MKSAAAVKRRTIQATGHMQPGCCLLILSRVRAPHALLTPAELRRPDAEVSAELPDKVAELLPHKAMCHPPSYTLGLHYTRRCACAAQRERGFQQPQFSEMPCCSFAELIHCSRAQRFMASQRLASCAEPAQSRGQDCCTQQYTSHRHRSQAALLAGLGCGGERGLLRIADPVDCA